jgi:hypothetical protein
MEPEKIEEKPITTTRAQKAVTFLSCLFMRQEEAATKKKAAD